MTNKDAFIVGVEIFCKRAGFDSDDAKQMTSLLLSSKDEAEPIVKAAAQEVKCARYVRAGTYLSRLPKLVKHANYESAMAALNAMNLSTADWSRLASEAQRMQSQPTTAGGGGPQGSGAGYSSSPNSVTNTSSGSVDASETDPAADADAKERVGFWDVLSSAGTGAAYGSSLGMLGGPFAPITGTMGAIGGGVLGLGKGLWDYFTQDDEEPAPAKAPKKDSTQDAYEKYKAQYEASPYKGQMSLQQYAALKGQYDAATKTSGNIIPEDAFIGGRWAATKNRIATNQSRRTMRGMGYSLAPGELAGMSEADIQSRTSDPGEAAALRQARDLAAARQKRQGGRTSSRMGMGFSAPPTQVAQTSQGAVSQGSPPTSTAPAGPGNGGSGAGVGAGTGGTQRVASRGSMSHLVGPV